MTNGSTPGPRAYAVINTLYYLVSAAFFGYLFNYYVPLFLPEFTRS